MTSDLSAFRRRHFNRFASRIGAARRRFDTGRTPSWINILLAVTGAFALPPLCRAGEGPFFVTYTHQMEEPGNLEFATKNVVGNPNGGNRFLGTTAEFEYGVKGWWTSELYLDGQATGTHSALFTGYRWENRFRPLSHEHWINPVLYLEFENINGADKTLLEVVNHDGNDDLTLPNRDARFEKKREVEAKLKYSAAITKGGRLPKTSLLRRTSSTHRSSSVMQWGSAVPSPWKRDPTDATFVPRIFKWA